MWMKLELAIQNEISQKEKNKYRILRHIYMESRKMVLMNLFSWQEKRDSDIENRFMDTVGTGECRTN